MRCTCKLDRCSSNFTETLSNLIEVKNHKTIFYCNCNLQMSLIVTVTDHVAAGYDFDNNRIGDDVWVEIICFLKIKDFLNIRVTSKYFQNLSDPNCTRINNYWSNQVKQLCFIDPNTTSNQWYKIFMSLTDCTFHIHSVSNNKTDEKLIPINFITMIDNGALKLKFPVITILFAVCNNHIELFNILLNDLRLYDDKTSKIDQRLTVDDLIEMDNKSLKKYNYKLKLQMPFKIKHVRSNQWILEAFRVANLNGNVDFIRLIVNKFPFIVNSTFETGSGEMKTALHAAICSPCNIQVTNLLLRHKKPKLYKRTLNFRDAQNQSTLNNICRKLNVKWDFKNADEVAKRVNLTTNIMKKLIARSGTAILNRPADNNRTPLGDAIVSVECLTRLNNNHESEENTNKIEYVMSMVKTLLECDKTDINTRLSKASAYSMTILMYAVDCDNLNLVQLILNADKRRSHRGDICIDMSAVDESGRNVFHFIAQTGNTQILEAIYNHVINVRGMKIYPLTNKPAMDYQDKDCTPYLVACKHCHDIIKSKNCNKDDLKVFFHTLIDKCEVDITIRDRDGRYGSYYVTSIGTNSYSDDDNDNYEDLEWISQWLKQKELNMLKQIMKKQQKLGKNKSGKYQQISDQLSFYSSLRWLSQLF